MLTNKRTWLALIASALMVGGLSFSAQEAQAQGVYIGRGGVSFSAGPSYYSSGYYTPGYSYGPSYYNTSYYSTPYYYSTRPGVTVYSGPGYQSYYSGPRYYRSGWRRW